ncbi:putative transmembrane protein [Helianthus annuus]|nr:putative transmembrane protein [Helianthus annuus]
MLKRFSFPYSFLLLFIAHFFFLSNAESHCTISQSRPLLGKIQRRKYDLVDLWGSKRLLGDAQKKENISLVLAQERTTRKDPLDKFKIYRGGWNITESHYWASVAFTAAPFLMVAAAWFVIFGLFLSIILLCYCCCRKEQYAYSKTAYTLSLILLILFTITAIVGSIVLYTGQGKFDQSTNKMLKYIVHQAELTAERLGKVCNDLAAAKKITVAQVFLPVNMQDDIDEIQTKLNVSAVELSHKTKENRERIHDILQRVSIALIVISAVMLLWTFLGFFFSIYGLQCMVYILVLFGWLFVTITLILCGVFLCLHNVTADSCVAMSQWVANPTARTALDDILPCVDNATAHETSKRAIEVTIQIVTVINQVIKTVSNGNFPPSYAPLYYNQSGPMMPPLCNPYNPDFTNRTCDPNEVALSEATRVYKKYVCQISSSQMCITTGRVTPDSFSQMSAAIELSYTLYLYGPFLVDLQDCTFVRQTFTDILEDHCPGLCRYLNWIYIGLLMVSLAVMFSLIFWVIYGRERRYRVYTN